MFSDTDVVCVAIYLGCVKTKVKESTQGLIMVQTKTTHTHTLCAKELQQFAVAGRSGT